MKALAWVDRVGAVAGFAAVEYGIGQISGPAAWIVGGLVVMVAACWPVQRKVG